MTRKSKRTGAVERLFGRQQEYDPAIREALARLAAALGREPAEGVGVDMDTLLATPAKTMGGVGDKVSAAMTLARLSADLGEAAAEMLKSAHEDLRALQGWRRRGGARPRAKRKEET